MKLTNKPNILGVANFQVNNIILINMKYFALI